MSRELTDLELDEVIDNLTGTSGDLDDQVDTVTDGECGWNDLTAENHQKIDDEIFKCDNCGWWCETSEQNVNNLGLSVCDDCIESEDGDEYEDD